MIWINYENIEKWEHKERAETDIAQNAIWHVSYNKYSFWELWNLNNKKEFTLRAKKKGPIINSGLREN